MAKYLILIYGDDREWEAMPEDERRKLYEAHRAFSASAGAAIISSEELQPSPLATTLRFRRPADHHRRAVPGDQGGARRLIEAADLDEVIARASTLYEPSAGHGGAQIRSAGRPRLNGAR